MSKENENYFTVVKEIHKDSLKKYINLSEDMFRQHNITDKSNIRGYLEIQNIEVPDDAKQENVMQIAHITVLLVLAELTVSIKIF